MSEAQEAPKAEETPAAPEPEAKAEAPKEETKQEAPTPQQQAKRGPSFDEFFQMFMRGSGCQAIYGVVKLPDGNFTVLDFGNSMIEKAGMLAIIKAKVDAELAAAVAPRPQQLPKKPQ